MTGTLHERVATLPGVTRRAFAAGRPISPRWQAEPVHIVIERGHLAVCSRKRDSHELFVVEVLSPGSCLVPSELRAPSDRDYELLALTPASVLVLPLARHRLYLAADAELARAALEAKVLQIEATRQRLNVLALEGASRRVTGALLFLASRIAAPCHLACGLPMALSHWVVAAVANVTRQTASMELKKLNRARLIHMERNFVCLLRRESLEAVAHGRLTPRPAKGQTSCRLRHPATPLDCAEPRGSKGLTR